jgi:hypothetical protein
MPNKKWGLVALFAAAFLGTPRVATAQDFIFNFPGNLNFRTLRLDAGPPPVWVDVPDSRVPDQSNFLKNMWDAAWSQNQPSMCPELWRRVEERVSAHGQHIYDTECNIRPIGAFYARMVNQTLEIKYLVNGNNVAFTSTQPTPLGSWADPRFRVSFDIEIDASIVFPRTFTASSDPHLGPLQLNSARAFVRNADVEPDNLVADVLSWVDSLIGFVFGDRTQFQTAQDTIDQQVIDVAGRARDGLVPANLGLNLLSLEGFSIMTASIDVPSGDLRLRVRKPFVPTLRPDCLLTAGEGRTFINCRPYPTPSMLLADEIPHLVVERQRSDGSWVLVPLDSSQLGASEQPGPSLVDYTYRAHWANGYGDGPYFTDHFILPVVESCESICLGSCGITIDLVFRVCQCPRCEDLCGGVCFPPAHWVFGPDGSCACSLD